MVKSCVYLKDANSAMIDAWRQRWPRNQDPIQLFIGSGEPTDFSTYGRTFIGGTGIGFATAGNSYGLMSGGLDLVMAKRFPGVEDRVQLCGFIPVGEAVRVPTGDPQYPYLVYAPTMETAKSVIGTDNAYRAMRAILRVADDGVIIPGLCSGVGRMPLLEVASQMAQAYYDHIEAEDA
jgi:hypothetical protein